MWPCSSQTHQTKIHTTPLKPNTDTDTPSESYCSATPFTVFHNFTSSSISPIIPRDCTVSHDNPIMTSSYCITFIRAGETMRMYFWISVSGDCSFVFVSCVCACACRRAQCCQPIPRVSYDDEFTQEHSVPLQHFLQPQEMVVLLLMRDAERLTEACRILIQSAAKHAAWKQGRKSSGSCWGIECSS